MARIKGGMNAKKKHNRVLKLAKGYRGARSKQYRVAKQSVMRALTESYKGRKQKKRLCIARALLKKPKILILDDSTSAVDTKTDALIRKAFKDEIPDTTKIIIAQRISSVQDADCIIVMEGGKIDGCGTHEQLLKENAIYKEIYESQTKGDEQ